MKKLWLIPALCLVCCACNSDRDKQDNGVQSQEQSEDWKITTKVKAELLSDTTISATARFVSVTTNNGVVTLTGIVPSKEDSEKIVRITKKVHGVVRVDNQMTISR